MYPLNEAQPFPLKQWWIAAYSSEVTREILGRTILDTRVVLFRTEAGEPVALSGICPHRLYPMEKGRLVGDLLQCGYHGFAYDCSGACVNTPSQTTATKAAALKHFPVIERAGLIWIWMGASAADPTNLPDLETLGLNAPGWATEQHPLAVLKGRYTLLIDNLLDLSHISFIHHDTIPNGEAVATLPHEIVDSTKSLMVKRLGRGIEGPHTRMLFPQHDGAVDQRFDAEYFGPCLVRTGGNIYAAGTDQVLGVTNFIHGITPETTTSTHYFVMTTRNFKTDDPHIGMMNFKMGERIQPQDVDAIEAVEQSLSMQNIPREVSCLADAGAIQVRRRLSAQIRAESAANTSTS